MTPFLNSLARYVFDNYKEDLSRICMVFPNRRAGMFFTRHLSEMIDRPVWKPAVYTISDLMSGLSGIGYGEDLDLLYDLYRFYIREKFLPIIWFLARRILFGQITWDGGLQQEIIGVVNDFHYASMHNKIDPLVMVLNDVDMRYFYANIKIGGADRQGTIDFVDQVRKQFNDRYPFKYAFMEDRLADYYRSDGRISNNQPFM